MKKFMAVLVLATAFAAGMIFAGKPDLTGLLNQGYEALNNWHFQDADRITAEVQTALARETNDHAKEQGYNYLAKYWFYKGDYSRAVMDLDTINALNPKPDQNAKEFYNRVKQLAEAFQNARQAESEHFRIRWVDPRDEVMVKPGLQTLEKAFQTLSRDFNITPSGEKILVEIYPSLPDLAAGVGLEEKMFKDSGTVAICKFRRLMLVSPRCLLFGYDYQTTMSHELSHFFIKTKGGENVPIWLHEGLAKFEEQAYKGTPGQIDPVSKSFLVSAINNNELVTFAQMHPTFAQFKTPKESELAFAEVVTMVDYLKQSCGSDAWFRILDQLQKGMDDKLVVEQVCGKSFESVWNGWRKYVLAKNWPVLPGAEVAKLEFKEQTGKQNEAEEEPIVEKGKANESIRLGDLLRAHGSYAAAAFEYQKALAIQPYSAMVLNKLGLSLIGAGNFKAALEPFSRLTSIYPNYSTGFVHLGFAYDGLKDDSKAISTLERAMALNPFNPIVYEKLADIYQKRGDTAKVNQMQEAFNIINKKPGG